MKKLSILVTLIILFTATVFAQSSTGDVLYLKNGSIIRGQITELSPENVKIKTSDGSVFIYPMTEIEKIVKEPITEETPAPAPKKAGISFGLRGGLFASVQIWDQLEDKSASKTGVGLMSTITAGINIDDDMYVGVGPHVGGSFWGQNYTMFGYTCTGIMNVLDYGGSIVFEFEDMYLMIGLGSANVSFTATVDDLSETVDMPEPASYKQVGLGWGSGLAIGISYVSYSDWAKTLSRFEINLGFMF